MLFVYKHMGLRHFFGAVAQGRGMNAIKREGKRFF